MPDVPKAATAVRCCDISCVFTHRFFLSAPCHVLLAADGGGGGGMTRGARLHMVTHIDRLVFDEEWGNSAGWGSGQHCFVGRSSECL